MDKSEQLEVTQGFVCPKEEYAAFCTWAKNTLPFIDTPSVASHLFGAWIGSARHRLTTEARMAEAVEALTKAAERFREYETSHAAKGSIDGDLKALRNCEMAEMCETALAKIRSQSNG